MTRSDASRRRLATVLFTDIVGSTERLAELGDEAWAAFLRRHNGIVRAELEHFGGREVSTTGDGFLAVFDAPVQAVLCAVAIRDALKTMGLDVRAGAHTGEIEETGDDVGGIAVHIAARVLEAAEPGEVLVSRTVKDVVGGSNVLFERRGERQLRGVPGEWRVYSVRTERVDEGAAGFAEAVRRGVRWLRDRPRVGEAAIAIAVVSLVMGVGLWTRRGPSGADAATYESLAVLPFANMSGDPGNEYFSDGITEDIITHVSRIEGLDVISRTSAMRYKGSTKSLREIGRDLGVDAILEGSVRREGDQVRITAQLVDARSDTHLWAEDWDRDVADVFAIQTEIASRIADALQATISPGARERLARSPTDDLEAYDLYLQGRDFYYDYTPEANERAIELFRRALERDRDFALAQAGLADAYGQKALGLAGTSPEWSDSALFAARRAVELDPDLAEAHKALGLALNERGLLEEAIRENRIAIDLNPGYHPAVANLGSFLAETGRLDEALPWVRRARSLSPNEILSSLILSNLYRMLGMLDPAEAYFLRAEALNPGHSQVTVTRMLYLVTLERRDEAVALARRMASGGSGHPDVLEVSATVLAAAEEFEAARRAIEADRILPIDATPVRAYVLLRTGEPERARAALAAQEATARARIDAGSESWRERYQLAQIHAVRGERDAAIGWIEEAIGRGMVDAELTRDDPTLASIAGDPRLERLLDHVEARVARMRERVLAAEARRG